MKATKCLLCLKESSAQSVTTAPKVSRTSVLMASTRTKSAKMRAQTAQLVTNAPGSIQSTTRLLKKRKFVETTTIAQVARIQELLAPQDFTPQN